MTDVLETETQVVEVPAPAVTYFELLDQYRDLAAKVQDAERRLTQARQDAETASNLFQARQSALVESLRSDVAQLRDERRQDGETLSDIIAEEADDDDLYDSIREAVDQRTNLEMRERLRKFNVDVQVRVAFSVGATGDDDARNKARDVVDAIEELIDNQSVADVDTTAYPENIYDYSVEEES